LSREEEFGDDAERRVSEQVPAGDQAEPSPPPASEQAAGGDDREPSPPPPEAAVATPVTAAHTPAAAAVPPGGAASLGASLAALAAPVAWVALLLALIGLWLVIDGQRRESQLLLDDQRHEAEVLQRVQALESVSGQDTTTFDQMRSNLQRQIELAVQDVEARQQRFQEDQARAAERLQDVARDSAASTQRALSAEIEQLGTQFEELRDSQRAQSQRIAQLGIADRDSWLLAEAQYLLRLANQRLIMTGDTLSAEALMSSADAILREIGDVDLHKLRGALASDLVAVRAVPRLDLEGLYLRVGALIDRTDELVMFEMPEIDAPEPLAEDADWRERLAYGYQSAMAKLSEYIVVSRRDTPIETLMDPQYEGLVRQNMRMLLEQAQVALLSGNQSLYQRSLERASGWVEAFFKDDQDASRAMRRELADLAGERVSVELPDLSESLESMDEVVRLRLERNKD
jgi:uroporphyrin-3 C-methyltransferase